MSQISKFIGEINSFDDVGWYIEILANVHSCQPQTQEPP